ncbi:MAG: glycosyltransferase family 2 protein [Anaerolineae bacterium]
MYGRVGPAGVTHQPSLRASVIIPNWNGLGLLRPCLDSLARQTLSPLTGASEVIVVDNGSADDSVAVLRREYPWVRVLALAENRGYAGGCNAGMAAARGEVLVLLNNDTEAEPDWLALLVEALERHPEAGIAASRMMLFDRRDTLHSAGDLMRVDGTGDSRGVWQPYGPPWDQPAWVFGGCGGAMAVRRSVIDQIGAFEERFFMYCEDVDLNWRAQLAGWKARYVPEAVVYHHLSATGGGALASYYVGRNLLWVIARNYPAGLYRKYRGDIWRAQWRIAREALRAWRGKAARARLRGQLAGLLRLPGWRAERRRAQGARAGATPAVSEAYIESILEGSQANQEAA